MTIHPAIHPAMPAIHRMIEWLSYNIDDADSTLRHLRKCQTTIRVIHLISSMDSSDCIAQLLSLQTVWNQICIAINLNTYSARPFVYSKKNLMNS